MVLIAKYHCFYKIVHDRHKAVNGPLLSPDTALKLLYISFHNNRDITGG